MRQWTASARRQHICRCVTADNKIPGPNEPVDFDTGPFITQGLSPTTSKPVRYYNFDVQGTASAPFDVLYREGEEKPVEGQLDTIDTLPGEKGYNDFRQVWKVTVPKDDVANSITDAGTRWPRRPPDATDGHVAEHAGGARQVESEHAPKRRKPRAASRLVWRRGCEVFQLR